MKAIGPEIRCKLCGTVIQSTHRHDFVTCKCGKISADGGAEYTRVLWPSGNPEDFFEIIKGENAKLKGP